MHSVMPVGSNFGSVRPLAAASAATATWEARAMPQRVSPGPTMEGGDGDAAGHANPPDGVARDDGVGVAARTGRDVAGRGDGGEEQRGKQGEREGPRAGGEG